MEILGEQPLGEEPLEAGLLLQLVEISPGKIIGDDEDDILWFGRRKGGGRG